MKALFIHHSSIHCQIRIEAAVSVESFDSEEAHCGSTHAFMNNRIIRHTLLGIYHSLKEERVGEGRHYKKTMVAKVFSQEPYKKVSWMVLWSNFFNGNLTSFQLEGPCAISPSPLQLMITCKNFQETKGRGSFSTDGNCPIIFRKL